MKTRRRLRLVAIWLSLVLGAMGRAADQPESPAIEEWTVTLVDAETGEPIPDVDVEVKASRDGSQQLEVVALTSDAEGKARFSLPTGKATTVHLCEPGWWMSGWALVGNFDIDNDGKFDGRPRSDEHRVQLWRGTEVRGKLLAPEGTPAAGVSLRAGVYLNNTVWLERLGRESRGWNSWDHGQWPNWETSGKTKEDGNFSITVPPPDARSWVRVGTSGLDFQAIDTDALARNNKDHALVRYAPFEVEVNGSTKNRRVEEQDGVLELGTLQLERGVVLRGRVLDAEGQPLAGVHLFTSNRHGPYGGRKTVSQADGTFEFAPMSPGTFTLRPDATLRDSEGVTNSRDVQAVFVNQDVTLTAEDDVVEMTVQAVPHVELEFEWVDRRTEKGQPVSYYGEFPIHGRLARDGAKPVGWRGVTEKVNRDGKELLVMKVPREVIEPTLTLPADQRVTASYSDGETESGPGRIQLGDVTQAKRRIIYGDEPRERR